jgi:hypothetical protein
MSWLYKKIGLVLFGLFIAAVFSEVFLRVLGFPASSIYRVDEKTGLLTFKPNSEIYIRSDCFFNTIKTNSFGFHSKEHETDKKKDFFRIAIIGDSFIEASQVPVEKTFAYLLEQELNSQAGKERKYEVIPFGISSHGTYESLLYLKAYALDFKPDLVIAAYSLNDLDDDAGKMIRFDEAGRPVLEIGPVGRKSIIQKAKDFSKRNLRKSVLVTTLRREILLLKTGFEEKIVTAPLSDKFEITAKAWDIEEKLLSAFNEISKEGGSKFLLISLADARVYSDSVNDTGETEKLKSIAEKNSFSYFDMMPVFKNRLAKENKMIVWPCDGHWNEDGNQWAADALFEYLVKNENLLSD